MKIKKLNTGHYQGTREDGLIFEVQTGGKGWNLYSIGEHSEQIYSYDTKKEAVQAGIEADTDWWKAEQRETKQRREKC